MGDLAVRAVGDGDGAAFARKPAIGLHQRLDRQKQPDVALVVVIDKSGSMDACHCNSFEGGMGGGSGIAGVKKTDIGKEAILRAASALTERDELGVVAFDQADAFDLGTDLDHQG